MENKPELLGVATELNPDMETVEQAAERYLQVYSNEPDEIHSIQFRAFLAGAQYQSTNLQKLIEGRIKQLERDASSWHPSRVEELTNLFTSFKTVKE